MDEFDFDERSCDCGNCKLCDLYLKSDYDFEGDDFVCSVCNGGGCARCE